MAGMVDLGVLCYMRGSQAGATGTNQVEHVPASTRPSVQVDQRADPPTSLRRETRKGTYHGNDAGYAYYYYDGRATTQDTFGEHFLACKDGLELELQFPNLTQVGHTLDVFFVKRSPELSIWCRPRRAIDSIATPR